MAILEKLKDESLILDNLLTQYIDLHNTFLKSSGTFMSLFKKIDFKRMAENSYLLFEKLRDEKNKLVQLKDKAEGDKEKEFADCLFLYVKALTETVHLLFIMFNALKEKAEGNKSEKAAMVGKLIAEKALAAGITEVVFDRGGYLYHGRVKQLADAAREGGLKF